MVIGCLQGRDGSDGLTGGEVVMGGSKGEVLVTVTVMVMEGGSE